MPHPRRNHFLSWWIALIVAFGASPMSVLLASDPTCRMNCANTANCCCKPRPDRHLPDGTFLEPRIDRETCPDRCSVVTGAIQIGFAPPVAVRTLAADANTGAVRTVEDRLTSNFIDIHRSPRAPPISL